MTRYSESGSVRLIHPAGNRLSTKAGNANQLVLSASLALGMTVNSWNQMNLWYLPVFSSLVFERPSEVWFDTEREHPNYKDNRQTPGFLRHSWQNVKITLYTMIDVITGDLFPIRSFLHLTPCFCYRLEPVSTVVSPAEVWAMLV